MPIVTCIAFHSNNILVLTSNLFSSVSSSNYLHCYLYFWKPHTVKVNTQSGEKDTVDAQPRV